MSALISGENLGKRNAAKPRAHWHPKSRAAKSPIQLRKESLHSENCQIQLMDLGSDLCSVYMLGFGGLALL